MYHNRISNLSTQIQRVIMMKANSLTNLNEAFLIQTNWFLIHLLISGKVLEKFVLNNIREFPDLNENDLSAADIAGTTLKKLLDNVEKTSNH